MQIGYDPAKSEYIPNGFDLQRFAPNRGGKDQRRQQYGIPVGAIAIGLIARFDPLKDHDNFIMAARLLHQRHPSTHFVLCGDGIGPGNTALLELMDRNRVADCFSLLGYRTDIPEVLSTLDLVASASRGEAFPLTIGEAMACAIPCVVTDVGDSATIVGNFGKVVPPGDPAALANAWEELILLGEDGRIRLGLEARERICKHYSIERCVDSYQNLFDRLCA